MHHRPLGDRAEFVARLHGATGLPCRHEWPLPILVQHVGPRAGSDEVPRRLGHPRQRATHAIEHRAQQSRPQLRGQRHVRRLDRFADRQPRRVLVHLQRRHVATLRDHLAQQAPVADERHLEERRVHRRRLHQ